MMYPHCSVLTMDLGYLFIQSLKSHFDLNTQIFLSLKTQPLVHVVRGGNSASVFQVHPSRCLNGPGIMLANGALVKQTNREKRYTDFSLLLPQSNPSYPQVHGSVLNTCIVLCRRNSHFLDPCITACSSIFIY